MLWLEFILINIPHAYICLYTDSDVLMELPFNNYQP